MMDTKAYLDEFASICESGTYSDFNNLSRRKSHFVPTKLYKYSALASYTIKNLQRKQIYLSNPEDFNDPFDTFAKGHELLEKMLGPLEIAARMFGIPPSMLENDRVREKLVKTLNEGHKEHPGFRKATGICCFTEKSPSKIIMWSHYANQHKGICLEYDFSKCDDIIRSLYPMLYREKYIVRKSSRPPKANALYDRDAFMLLLIQTHLIKSKEWKYEKEWRILKHPDDKNREFSIALNPTHIYLGLSTDKLSNSDQSILNQLKKLAEKNNIPISQMRRSEDEYSLHPIRLE